VTGATTIKTLRQTAAALGCDYVCAIVPFEPLSDMLLKRAEQEARKASDLAEERHRIVAQIVFGSPRGLWNA
jgi:hypothetical protein